MICQSCRTSLFSHIKHSSSSPYLRLLTNSSRPYSGTPSFLSSTPAPSSPSIALPSTGASPPPPPQQAADDASKASGGKVLSSCTVGTRLQGLNYMKNKPDLVALDDSEYPSWLWGILEDGKRGSGKGNAEGAEGEIQMNRKQRKRHEKKVAAAEAAKPRRIPVHEQAIDVLPASAASNPNAAATGQNKRKEITKSARESRRKGIREANYLKGL